MLHQARRSALASSGRHSFGIVLTFLTAVLSMAAGVQALAQNYDEFFKKCYANGDPDQTIIACSAVITTGLDDNIDLATAFKNRGNAYDDKGRYDRALEDYDQAITINPHDADAFNNRGTTHSAMGHYDLAIRDYDQAVKAQSFQCDDPQQPMLCKSPIGSVRASVGRLQRVSSH